LVALQPHGSRIPLFCIPNADENPYSFLDLANGLGLDQPVFAVRDPRPLQERGVYTVEQHAARFRAAMCAMRPQGPYVLGGHCYGGIVAFELARQLLASGHDVRLVALFEVPTPGYPKVVRQWKKYFRQSANLASAMLRGEIQAGWAGVRSHLGVWRKLLGRKRQAVTRRVLVSAGMQAVIEPVERIELRNERAGRAYTPNLLHCNVVQFLAADELSSTVILDDPRLGWRDAVGSGFSVRKIPCRAGAIFKTPNVDELASQLGTLLDHANTAESGS
jgi:thioesterase domain-containing protein